VDTAGVKSPLKKAIQYTNEIVLEHNQNVIGFEFSSLNFSNSGKTRYSCKLDGFDDKWFIVDGKNGRVSYTNLNPGNYVFRVKIAGSNNKVNLPETSVKLTILAPWWASGLAYFCYFTIFGALLFFIRKYFADKQKLKSSFPDHIERNLAGASIELAPSSPEIPDAERLFLDKLMAITEKHLSDSDFDVSQFALELGMEASVLHRKLKVLINQSPGDFIRTMRMKRAAQLLADKSISISEVASQVGFGNNTNYFSTAFRRHFGKSPKEFQQN